MDDLSKTSPVHHLRHHASTAQREERFGSDAGWRLGDAGERFFSPDVGPYYKAPALLLQLNIELEAGKTVSVASDNSWKVAPGPLSATAFMTVKSTMRGEK